MDLAYVCSDKVFVAEAIKHLIQGINQESAHQVLVIESEHPRV